MKNILNQTSVGVILACCAAAQPPGATVLTFDPGSSVKLEQILGDCDYQAQAQQIVRGQTVTCGVPTASQTFTRYQLRGDGQCSNFEGNGKLIFMCGDASNGSSGGPGLHGFDPIGYSTTSDPEAPLADFAGLVTVGEFQINFKVPQLVDGTYPISVAVNGVSSPATINSDPPAQIVLPIEH